MSLEASRRREIGGTPRHIVGRAASSKERVNGLSCNTKRSFTSAPAPARDPAMITNDL